MHNNCTSFIFFSRVAVMYNVHGDVHMNEHVIYDHAQQIRDHNRVKGKTPISNN